MSHVAAALPRNKHERERKAEGGKGSTPVQASAVRKQDRLTRKLWLWLRQLGGGLSKHKWAVDKGGGGRRGGRLGGLLKYGGGGGSC